MFEVQHYTLCDGWVNTWLDGSDNPITFKTYNAAARELANFLRDNQADYVDGHIYTPEDPSDYRIASIDSDGNEHVHPTIREAMQWSR